MKKIFVFIFLLSMYLAISSCKKENAVYCAECTQLDTGGVISHCNTEEGVDIYIATINANFNQTRPYYSCVKKK